MRQAKDNDENIVPNTGYHLEDPIPLASGVVSTAFLKKTVVILTARVAECFFRISSDGTAATTNSHPLAVGASRQVPINVGDRIANTSTGGTLVVTVLGASHQEPRTNYYA